MCRFSKIIRHTPPPIRRKWIEIKIPQVLELRIDIYPPPSKPNLCKKRAKGMSLDFLKTAKEEKNE